MKTQINKTTENFLNWSYKGDGKYYTIEQKSQSYGNTTFQTFYNRNWAFCKITASGNDAPRGGKTGNFVIVEFTEDFKKIAADFFAAKKALENAEIERLAKKNSVISEDIKKALAIVDEQYSLDVEIANKLVGKEKSEARKNALIMLLNRNSLEITYFYEVMRAI